VRTGREHVLVVQPSRRLERNSSDDPWFCVPFLVKAARNRYVDFGTESGNKNRACRDPLLQNDEVVAETNVYTGECEQEVKVNPGNPAPHRLPTQRDLPSVVELLKQIEGLKLLTHFIARSARPQSRARQRDCPSAAAMLTTARRAL